MEFYHMLRKILPNRVERPHFICAVKLESATGVNVNEGQQPPFAAVRNIPLHLCYQSMLWFDLKPGLYATWHPIQTVNALLARSLTLQQLPQPG